MYRSLSVLFLAFTTVQSLTSFSLDLKKGHVRKGTAKYARYNRLSNVTAMNKATIHRTYSEDNKDYFIDITIGVSGRLLQPFQLVIDTGSTALWVPGQNCRTLADEPKNCQPMQGNVQLDNPRTFNSVGHQQLGRFSTKYMLTINTPQGTKNGNAKGKLVKDLIWLTDPGQAQPIQAGEMTFGVADTIEMPEDNGMIGLAPIDNEHETRLGDQFLKLITDKYGITQFTLFYSYVDDEDPSTYTYGGKITFGDYDREHCHGVPAIVPVISGMGTWQFYANALYVGAVQLPFNNPRIVSDSGTPDIQVPTHVYHAILDNIPKVLRNQGIRPVIRRKYLSKVSIVLRIGDMPFHIPTSTLALLIERAEDANGNPKPENDKFELRITDNGNNSPLDQFSAWTFGTPWIRAFCQFHDWSDPNEPKIGFSRVKHLNDANQYVV